MSTLLSPSPLVIRPRRKTAKEQTSPYMLKRTPGTWASLDSHWPRQIFCSSIPWSLINIFYFSINYVYSSYYYLTLNNKGIKGTVLLLCFCQSVLIWLHSGTLLVTMIYWWILWILNYLGYSLSYLSQEAHKSIV